MLPALINTSSRKLISIAHAPKERKYAARASTSPLTARANIFFTSSPANSHVNKAARAKIITAAACDAFSGF